MPTFRIRTSSFLSLRQFTTSLARRQTSSLPYIPTCPSPTCTCAPTPADLDIDRKTPLLNTMAPYSEQVLVCTGKEDWSSRIEDEEGDTGGFIRGLRGIIGKGGESFDPFNNILVTASSFPASTTSSTTTALLFPSFRRIPNIPHTTPALSAFATAYLKSCSLHPAHAGLSDTQKAKLLRNETKAQDLPPPKSIKNPTILICGHGGRDKRCGILGPILHQQFRTELERRGINGDVGLISHIGGHKYAGNVIVYLPPRWRGNIEGNVKGDDGFALSGTGIWYGRVDPSNVEGIVSETIMGGKVIKELFRGGVSREGVNLGRALEEQVKREGGEDGVLKLRPKAR